MVSLELFIWFLPANRVFSRMMYIAVIYHHETDPFLVNELANVTRHQDAVPIVFFSLLADFSSHRSFLYPTPSLSLHVAFSHVS